MLLNVNKSNKINLNLVFAENKFFELDITVCNVVWCIILLYDRTKPNPTFSFSEEHNIAHFHLFVSNFTTIQYTVYTLLTARTNFSTYGEQCFVSWWLLFPIDMRKTITHMLTGSNQYGNIANLQNILFAY
jgi:hypothetical protein